MEPIWTAAYLGALLLVAGIYDQVTKRIPSRLRADRVSESKFGIDRADNFGSRGRAYGVDIIFVHGLGSNPDTTWGPRRRRDGDTAAAQTTSDSRGKACWVSDFLPEDIPASSRKDIRIFFYNYDSYWKRDAVRTRLWNTGKSLLDRVATEIRRTEEERTRNLVFVGHSYGGLVIKRALIQASTSQSFADIAEHTRAVFFLGTPHRGSSFSRWGSIAAWALQPLGSNSLLIQEVAYDSESLLDLHREFVGSSRDKLRVVNFFEARKTRLIKVWFIQWEEFCVREQSATYDGANIENIELPVDHRGLNKFESKNENYGIILQKLLEIVTPIAPQRQRGVYSVPIRAVESYTVRHKLSLEVAEKLRIRHEKGSVPHALAIHGLGGTGKTQLALKYIEDHKDKYNVVIWIDAKDEQSVLSSFERCASELQLVVNRAQAQEYTLLDSPVVQAVRRWLRDRKDTDNAWMMIIDNADDVSWGIKKVLPEGSQGSIIITSQDSQSRKLVSGGCEELRVDTMEPLEARALLLQHLRWSPESVAGDLQKACDMVAERLGYLALAVDLAGAYIGNDADSRSALWQYLADYDRHQDDLLRSDYSHGLSATDKTVWTVWDTTLERLERRYVELQPGLLLAFLARFGGGVVQDELFRLASLAVSMVCEKLYDGAVELPSWLDRTLTADGEDWDSYHYRRSRDLLVRYSLLQRIEGEWPGVAMHGLVQWRARKYRQDQLWDKWCLVTILAGCVQLSREDARPQFRRHALAHISEVGWKYLDKLGVEDKRKAFVWSTISRVYYYEGQWKAAEELEVQVMETRKRVLGEEHPSTLISMDNLASTYCNQGRWKEAEELGVQVMKTSSRVLGEEYPDTLTSMANLASTYRNQGRWKEAEELGVQVMETRKRVLGEEHPSTLTSMANLASTYRNQGRWKEAKELEVQAMETRKRVLGEEHPDTLASVANLASTYWNQGRWKEAEELEVQVIETRKRVLGEEHPDTLISMANLASTYRDQGRWKEAEELEVQVIETRKRVLGEEHPDTLISMANLASTYWNQGRWKEAEELEVQVIETRKRVLGEEHPDTLISMANLASTYRNQGRWKEAEELEVQAMETSSRVLGEEHPDTLTSMANLASTYRNQGRWKEAKELEVQAMEARKRVLGEEHPHTLASVANLASTYWNQGRWKEAEELEVQAMETRKRVLGEEHPHMLTSMANLALMYWNQGRWKEAKELEVQAMETRKRVLGEEHPDTLTSMANLASTYWNQGRWKEAEELEVQVIEMRKRVLGEEHPDTLTSMANLASTYRDQGRWKEAEELFVQAMETSSRVLGEEHPDTLTSMANLASTYWDQGRWKEAEELFVQALETRKRVLGEEHPDTLTTISNLAATFKSQGRNEEAILLLEKCVQLQKQVLGPQHPHTTSSLKALNKWQLENKEIEV